MRIIQTPACLEEGARWLAAQDPRWGLAHELLRPLPLRRSPDGFGPLLAAIVGQQVSAAAAATIWARIEAAGLATPEAVLAAPEEALRGLGLSRQKLRYAKALAAADIDYPALRGLPTDEVVRRLVQVPGIGVWTAEIYAIFALGHADAFAPGDLGLQEGARLLFGLPARPREAPLRAMAAGWSPWQAVAARILWGYYHVAKGREGAP